MDTTLCEIVQDGSLTYSHTPYFVRTCCGMSWIVRGFPLSSLLCLQTTQPIPDSPEALVRQVTSISYREAQRRVLQEVRSSYEVGCQSPFEMILSHVDTCIATTLEVLVNLTLLPRSFHARVHLRWCSTQTHSIRSQTSFGLQPGHHALRFCRVYPCSSSVY